MTVSILSLTNGSITVSGVGVAFPIIKAQIDFDTQPTKSEINGVIAEIYSRVAGATTGISAWCKSAADPVFNFSAIPTGTQTYGDSNGWQIVINRNSSNTRHIFSTKILYQGQNCGMTTVLTGYSNYEACFAMIFVDKFNQLIKVPQSGNGQYTGINVRYDVTPGYAVMDNKYVVSTVLGGGTFTAWPDTYWPKLSKTNYDLTGKINNEKPIGETDPYGPGGNSGTGGGTGNFDGTSDSISIPGLPSVSAVDTGFITLFNPSISQLKSLATYMWTNPLFDPANWKKLFADPMDCILGLSIVPVAVPNGGSKTVTVGNISTGISMTAAASQYVSVDCGTLNVNEYWGSYLDYSPYTKAEIYLPYIGTRPISVDDIMDNSVHVVYHIDILSGACNAFVQCGSSVLYTFIGQCSSSIPISGNDYTTMINGIISAAVSIGSMVATEGATAPMAIPSLASTATNILKPNVEKSGAMSGTGGMLGVQTPYLILTRPNQCLPARQNEFSGYPSLVTRRLDSCTGYTEIEQVHLDGIGCTESEMREIENLLKSGVIF
jgi:hypothetical protein